MDALIEIKTLAGILGISERKIRQLVADNRIPYVRIDKALKFNRESIRDWITSKEYNPVPEESK